jgi:hypothetical protein
MMAMTLAKIGRSTKKWENRMTIALQSAPPARVAA